VDTRIQFKLKKADMAKLKKAAEYAGFPSTAKLADVLGHVLDFYNLFNAHPEARRYCMMKFGLVLRYLDATERGLCSHVLEDDAPANSDVEGVEASQSDESPDAFFPANDQEQETAAVPEKMQVSEEQALVMSRLKVIRL
jgi:hypothetical protein